MKPRVAIACSGLGHVRRGNETWAATVAHALHAAGVEVTLFGGGPRPDTQCPYVFLLNLRRDSFFIRRWLSWHRRYILEQITFARSLKASLRQNKCNLVHVADPALAARLRKWSAQHGVRVIYKDGLLLGPDWCRQFDFVQVLAPHYREQAAAAGVPVHNWAVIPHLVETKTFQPAPDRAAARQQVFGPEIPAGAFVILAAGDFAPTSRKRLDWVIEEVARTPELAQAHLIIAGSAVPADYARQAALAEGRLGPRVHLQPNRSPAQMAALYRTADAFAHAASREPFGIVFLEAMASGLPLVGHHYAVTQWIIGDAGQTVDMKTPGELGGTLVRWQNDFELRARLSRQARARAVSTFAPEKIAPLYAAMYEQALA